MINDNNDDITNIDNLTFGGATKLHIENVVADTSNGEITITIPEKSGKYTVDIIPIEDEK